MHHNTIAVYDKHEDAVNAVGQLIDKGFKAKEISLIGKTSAGNDLETHNSHTSGEVLGVSTVAGSVLGVLTGIGIFAIPGIGFLYGAGALAGAIAGADFGIIGGGIISSLLLGDEKKEISSIYDEYLKQGKTLLVFRGHEDENTKAFEALKAIPGASSVQQH